MNKNRKKSKVSFSISLKITLAIIVANLVIVSAIGIMVGLIVDKNVGEQTKQYAMEQLNGHLNQVHHVFSEIEIATKVLESELATMVDVQKLKNDINYEKQFNEEITKMVGNFDENLDITRSIYIYFDYERFGREIDMWYNDANDGNGFVQQASMGGAEFYVDGYHAWYHEPIKGNAIWTEPYMSTAGAPITSYVMPLEVDGEVVGMVGMDLYLGDIQEQINELVLFESGYIYLIHENGDLIVHKDHGWVDGKAQSLLDLDNGQELLNAMKQSPTGILNTVDASGNKMFSAYGHLSNGWILGSSIPESEMTAVFRNIIMFLIIIALIGLSIAIAVAFFIGRTISKPIYTIVEATEKISEGDLTVQVQLKSNDETSLLASALNKMSGEIKTLIKEAKNVGEQMIFTATDLAAMSEETNATVEEVATTIDEIAKGTNETAAEAESGATIAGIIDKKFDILIEKSKMMGKNATEVISVNEIGLSTLGILKDKSKIVEASNANVVKSVGSLEKRIQEVTDIINAISTIADQTNLLALNASIEAARAGEAGRGFAVVAEEIRKLAESSSAATDKISTIVSAIQKESTDTVLVMEKLNIITNEQNQAVGEVSGSFATIYASVNRITQDIDMVISELNALYASKDELIRSSNNISAVSEETAAATQEVNASMNEQTKAVEEVATSAEKLNVLSLKLKEHIDVFKVQ